MLLKNYVQMKDITQQEIADDLEVSVNHMRHVINLTRAPSRSLAIRIEEYTKKKVTRVEAMFPELFMG